MKEKKRENNNNNNKMSNLFDTGGAVIGAAANLWATHQTNQANARLQREQNEHNLQLWNLNNEYNSPIQQMQRLKDAGLNPDMMYGQGQGNAVGNSASPAQSQSPFPSMPFQVDPKLSAEVSNLMADTYKKKMEGKGQDLQNEIIDKTGMQQALLNLGFTQESINNLIQYTSNLHTAQDKMKEEIENIKKAREQMNVAIQKTLQETLNLKAEEATEKQALQLLYAQTEGQKLSNAQQQIVNEWLPKKMQQEIAEGYKRMAVMDSEIEQNEYENAYTSTMTELTKEKQNTEKKMQRNIHEDTNLKIANRVGVQIDNKTRDVRNKVEVAKGITESFENVTKGIYNVKETFWSSKDKKKSIGKTVKKGVKAYKVISAVVK